MHDANPEPQDPRSAAGVSRALQQAVNTRATFRSVARPGYETPGSAAAPRATQRASSPSRQSLRIRNSRPHLPTFGEAAPTAQQSGVHQPACFTPVGDASSQLPWGNRFRIRVPLLWAASRIAGRATPSAPTLNTAFHSPMLPHPIIHLPPGPPARADARSTHQTAVTWAASDSPHTNLPTVLRPAHPARSSCFEPSETALNCQNKFLPPLARDLRRVLQTERAPSSPNRAIIPGADAAAGKSGLLQAAPQPRPQPKCRGCHCLLCVSFLSPDMPLISAQKFSLCRLAK